MLPASNLFGSYTGEPLPGSGFGHPQLTAFWIPRCLPWLGMGEGSLPFLFLGDGSAASSR